MQHATRLLLIGLLVLSCNNDPKNNIENTQNVDLKISKEKLDTIKAKAYPVKADPGIFETAFFAGTKVKMDSFPISFFAINIGKLRVESGKLIACDPIVMRDAAPFLQAFPVGQFAVQLSIARINNDERVAFSRIVFSNKPVVQWKFALLEGQKQMPIDKDSFFGYGVDGGIGLFIDQEANTAFENMTKKNGNLWSEVFTDEMDKHYRNTWQYVLHDFAGHNLASFSTGYGDGTYATYVGYDEKGNICRLLTDFGLVSWWGK